MGEEDQRNRASRSGSTERNRSEEMYREYERREM